MTETDIRVSDFLQEDPNRSFTPCAFYNASTGLFSIFLYDIPNKPVPLIPNGTDILLSTDSASQDMFVGFQLWCDIPFVVQSAWKQTYCKISKKDVFRAPDCPILLAAIKKHNDERHALSAHYIVMCLLDHCPDVEVAWGKWKKNIIQTLETHDLCVHVPL